MWILETSPPRWLAPNKTYTLGRKSSRKQPDFISFDGTSISRNHMTIEIGKPNPLSFTEKSQVKVTDLKSKFGTTINDEPLHDSQTVYGDTIVLKLGPSTTLKLVWKPVNITYGTGEKGDAHTEMWNKAFSILSPLDIKLGISFTPETTHYMKGTNLTSKLALALVWNLPVLSNKFLDVIEPLASQFEDDFTQWPDESQFLEDPLWAPNPKRKGCFQKQAFVVLEEAQLTNLLPVISAAGGTIKLIDPLDIPEKSEILIKPKDKSLLTNSPATLFTEHAEILNCIKLAVPIVPQAGTPAHTTSTKSTTTIRKRPQKTGFLEFLTSSSGPKSAPKPAPNENVQVKQEQPSQPSQPSRKRPARVTMMDFMVGDGGKKEPASKAPKLEPKVETQTQVETVESLEPSLKRQLSSPRHQQSKRQHLEEEDQEEGLFVGDNDTQRSSAAPEPSEPVAGAEPFVDLDTNMSGLALVECRLIITKKVPQHSIRSEWAGRPNFKAFRRKGDAPRPPRPSITLEPSQLTVKEAASPPPAPPPAEISFLDVDNLPTKQSDPDADGEFGFKFTS